jgi:hypothetical protein
MLDDRVTVYDVPAQDNIPGMLEDGVWMVPIAGLSALELALVSMTPALVDSLVARANKEGLGDRCVAGWMPYFQGSSVLSGQQETLFYVFGSGGCGSDCVFCPGENGTRSSLSAMALGLRPIPGDEGVLEVTLSLFTRRGRQFVYDVLHLAGGVVTGEVYAPGYSLEELVLPCVAWGETADCWNPVTWSHSFEKRVMFPNVGAMVMAPERLGLHIAGGVLVGH